MKTSSSCDGLSFAMDLNSVTLDLHFVAWRCLNREMVILVGNFFHVTFGRKAHDVKETEIYTVLYAETR
jgi:hypothetical protein